MHAVELSFTLDELPLCLGMAKALLGYRDRPMSPAVEGMMDEARAGLSSLAAARGGYAICDGLEREPGGLRIQLDGVSLGVESVVFQRLAGANRVALLACTAGPGIEQEAARLIAAGELLQGYVLDVLGSLVAEATAERVHQAIRAVAEAEGLSVTNRYSPGYCGWPVEDQQRLFSMLPAGFCGIELLSSSLMRPLKSVSGLVGIGPDVRFVPHSCGDCDSTACPRRG